MSDHDIVVYGATSFVGELTAGYLAKAAPAGLRVALAGRSAERLAALRDRLGVTWPVIVADAADETALADMVRSTRVVATTVGPYSRYGLPLVRACAAAGTDYADLSGEVLFVRRSIDENDAVARGTGARIVHSCGFDSIPSDLGVHVLHAAVAADDAGDLTDTTLVVTSIKAGFSGGTVASMVQQLDEVRADPALRRIAARPYSLSPDPGAEPDLGRQSDLVSMDARDVDPALRGSLAPFVMASYNTRIVRRSNALRSYEYGRSFRYREAVSTGTSALSPVYAAGLKLGLGALFTGLTLPPTRWLLDRLLPAPGTGPSEQLRAGGHFTVDIFAGTTSGVRYTSRFRMKGDPGYAATAVMLGESVLSLALDDLPEQGGVLTPATALGDALVTRLRTAGATITAGRRT